MTPDAAGQQQRRSTDGDEKAPGAIAGSGGGSARRKGGGFDERLFVALRTRAHPRLLEAVVISLSVAGNWGLFWVGIGAALWAADATGGLRDFVYLLAVVYAALVVNIIIKVVLGRERPSPSDPALEPLVGKPSSKSFPSSHAAMSFAAACALSWLYAPLWPLYFAVAFIMSWSRVYAGVHYPSDVLAGTAVGLVMGGLGVLLLSSV